MILINLLPEEYRQRRRTPIKMLLATAALVAVNGTLVAYWAWTAFGVAAEVESELAVLGDTMDSLDPQIEYHRKLEQESKQYQARESTLASITQNRVSLTEKIDQMIDVINDGGDEREQYLIWLDDFAVSTKGDKKSAGSLNASGHSGSASVAQVANFLEDLEASPFSEGFNPPSPPEGTKNNKDEDLIPNVVWSFPLELTLKKPEERDKR